MTLLTYFWTAYFLLPTVCLRAKFGLTALAVREIFAGARKFKSSLL